VHTGNALAQAIGEGLGRHVAASLEEVRLVGLDLSGSGEACCQAVVAIGLGAGVCCAAPVRKPCGYRNRTRRMVIPV
jgi:hypothetical protein